MYNGINELIDDLMDHISLEIMYCSRARWRVSDLFDQRTCLHNQVRFQML